MSESLRSLRRNALRFAGLGLVLFHVQLLWQRWADGSLTDLTVVAKWLASGLLLAGLVVVHRRHGSPVRNRQAAVLWTLVLLLHALAGVPVSQMVAAPAPWVAVPLGLIALRTLILFVEGRSALVGPQRSLRHSSPVFARPVLAGHAAVPGGRAPPR